MSARGFPPPAPAYARECEPLRRDAGARRDVLRRDGPVGALGAAVVALAFVWARTGVPGWLPPALSVRLGVPSPLSGMTRSFVALASGAVGEAFHFHPLGPPAFVAAVVAAAVTLAALVRGRRFTRPRWMPSTGVAWGALGVVLAGAWVRQIVVLG